jgi:hypothetical protein
MTPTELIAVAAWGSLVLALIFAGPVVAFFIFWGVFCLGALVRLAWHIIVTILDWIIITWENYLRQPLDFWLKVGYLISHEPKNQFRSAAPSEYGAAGPPQDFRRVRGQEQPPEAGQ